MLRKKLQNCIPLNSPVHGSISKDKRRGDVKDLTASPAEGVEEGRMERTSKSSLPVGREVVGRDFLGSRAAWFVLVC